MAAPAPVYHCGILRILKVLRNEVGVFRSLASCTGQGAPGAGNLEVQRDGPRGTCWVVAREWVPWRRQ